MNCGVVGRAVMKPAKPYLLTNFMTAAHLKRLRYAGDVALEIDKFHGNNPAHTAREFLEDDMRRARRLKKMTEGKK